MTSCSRSWKTQLLTADLGVETASRIIRNLTEQASFRQLKDAEALYDLLEKEMADILKPVDQPLVIDGSKRPHIILMVGVNGVGKTTTIGKLAKRFQQEGKTVMLAAGDTFRAAAVEQLQVCGQRNQIPVIAQHTGADSASVIFDALLCGARAERGCPDRRHSRPFTEQGSSDGRAEENCPGDEEADAEAPHEVMLTLDAGTGQNALSQAKLFDEAVGITGITPGLGPWMAPRRAVSSRCSRQAWHSNPLHWRGRKHCIYARSRPMILSKHCLAGNQINP